MTLKAASTVAPASERRIHLVQGECRVTDDPAVVLATTLGSCVAACIRDPMAGVGGMNHFLLPESSEGLVSLRYGAFAMELLINGLLAQGGRRDRMEAKLFGGGRLSEGLADVGEKNAAFARDFLVREGITLSGGSVGGGLARRIQFWPVSGRARQQTLARGDALLFEPQPPRVAASDGTVDLF
ncbi:MAG TPA: chemotaxis protein CheD [Phenylobacterium sp.]|jgi:chemotaxis protein CheD